MQFDFGNFDFKKWKPFDAIWQFVTKGTPLIEKSITVSDLTLVMRHASIPSFAFFVMLALATFIASFGLIANSAPAIIGAMIISPLMAPIISLAFGVVLIERVLIFRSILTVIAGVILVIAIAYITTAVIGLRVTGNEILNRTAPSLLDLGVAVAAGAAASFAYTRKSIFNSIAGVAIAVALVPPLAVVGIGLALGQDSNTDTGPSYSELGLYLGGEDIAAGAFLLFLTNFVGIVIFSILTFLSQKFGNWRKSIFGLALFLLTLVLLFEPLGNSFLALYVKSRTHKLISNMQISNPDIVSSEARYDTIRVNFKEGVVRVYIKGIASKNTFKNAQAAQERLNAFHKYLHDEIQRPLEIDLEFFPVEFVKLRATSSDMPDELSKEKLEKQ